MKDRDSIGESLEASRAMQPARLPRSRIAGTYRWIAPVHDILGQIVERKARLKAFELVNIQNGDEVLEVAVGTGLNLRHIARSNPDGRYVGVDITPEMLAQARRKLRRISRHGDYHLQMGDAYSLSFDAEEFDVVVNSYMFDMLPAEDFVHVLSGFRRVLRKGGKLLLINMTPGPGVRHRIWEMIYRLHPPLLGGCRGVALESYAIEAGFRVLKRSFVSQWTFPSEILLCVKPNEGR